MTTGTNTQQVGNLSYLRFWWWPIWNTPRLSRESLRQVASLVILTLMKLKAHETKSEILQNLAEFQFSCVSTYSSIPVSRIFICITLVLCVLCMVSCVQTQAICLRYCTMQSWRMHAVSKALGWLPWTALAETLGKCLISSHSTITGSISMSSIQALTIRSVQCLDFFFSHFVDCSYCNG